PGEALRLPELSLKPVELEVTTTRFDLELQIWEAPGGLHARFYYNVDLFEPATVARMATHYQTLLEGAAARPEARLSELPLLTEGERRAVSSGSRGRRAEYPRDLTVHEVFEVQAARTPDAVAVVFGSDRLSYVDLNRRANRLAHRLAQAGVAPGDRVGICLERSLELIVGLLGILKAGAAYVPLDPEYPQPRLAFMLEDARPAVLLTQERLLASLPSTRVPVLRMNGDE